MPFRALKTYSSGDYHYVFGEVYSPLQVDTDGETMTAEDIQKMAHDFIAHGSVTAIDMEHNHVACGAEVVESFIARKEDPDYSEGSWVLGLRMQEGSVWEAVKSGDINGFSMDTFVKKATRKVLVEITKISSGNTEKSTDETEVQEHAHTFYVEFGDNGRVLLGTTDEVLGHAHKISGTVVTDKALGHSHRYFVE
jgi:hypothetical protein